MARSVLPLYTDRRALVEDGEGLECDSGCTRCELHEGVRTVCLRPRGTPGGLWVVGAYPGKVEDALAAPFSGPSGDYLRDLIRKHWSGPAAFDNALRCAPKRRKLEPKFIEACRPYLTRTLQEVAPTRILSLGNEAIFGLTGRAVPTLSARRGYTWTSTGVPIYVLQNPAAAMRNKFVRQWFESDLHWALTAPPPKLPPWDESFTLVDTVDIAHECAEACERAGWFAFDTETFGPLYDEFFEVRCVAVVAGDSEHAYVWPTKSIFDGQIVEVLRDLLRRPRLRKVAHNISYDLEACHEGLGVEVVGPYGCTSLWRTSQFSDTETKLAVVSELVGMGGHKGVADEALVLARRRVSRARATYARWLEQNERVNPGLHKDVRGAFERQSRARLSHRPWAQYDADAQVDSAVLALLSEETSADERVLQYAALHPFAQADKFAYGVIDDDVLHRYCALDTVACARLSRLLYPKIMSFPPSRLVFEELIEPALPTFRSVQAWGMKMDRAALRQLQVYLGGRVDVLKTKLTQYGDFNPNSHPQVRHLLFTKLGLPVIKMTKNRDRKKRVASTDHKVLLRLRNKHPAVAYLLDYRKVVKLLGTYAVALERHIRTDGRIHTSYHLDGARSGRLSSSDPNLQNQASRDADGKRIKACFCAEKGYTLVQLDYSQLELRVAAFLARDPKMRAIFQAGVDVHLRTAQMIAPIAFGVKPETITKGSDERAAAKTVVFGLLYGMEDTTLAANLNTTVEKAALIRSAILGEFRALARWIQQCIREARKTGYTWTYWLDASGQWVKARRRDLWLIDDNDEYRALRAEHGSYNTPVQGTASDLCLKSVSRIGAWIKHEQVPVRLIGTVHDSIMLEAPHAFVGECIYAGRRIMADYPTRGIPLVIDAETGPTWGHLKPYKEAA